MRQRDIERYREREGGTYFEHEIRVEVADEDGHPVAQHAECVERCLHVRHILKLISTRTVEFLQKIYIDI